MFFISTFQPFKKLIFSYFTSNFLIFYQTLYFTKMEIPKPCERFGANDDSVNELKDIIRKYGFLDTLSYVKKHIQDKGQSAKIQMYNHFSFYIYELYRKLKSGEMTIDPDREEVIAYEVSHDKLRRIFNYMTDNPNHFSENLFLTYKKMSIVNRELDVFADDEFLQKLDNVLGFSFSDLISFRNLKSPKDLMKLSKSDQKKLTKMVQNIAEQKFHIPSDSIIGCEVSIVSATQEDNSFFIHNEEINVEQQTTSHRKSSNKNEYLYSLDEIWLNNEIESRIQQRISSRNEH